MKKKEEPVYYRPVAVSGESTVVVEFDGGTEVREVAYQSESDLERSFVEILKNQAYEYLRINNESELRANLRHRLEALNSTAFSDAEWDRFFKECIAGKNDGIVEKTARIQEDHVQILQRDDGTTKNIYLIDKGNIHNNHLQVINQYESVGSSAGEVRANRYDVTILVNGLPLVHIELKRRGVDLREAFNQIDRYRRESFWSGSGLFEYVQLFVISNGTLTKYYSNTVRDGHIAQQHTGRPKRKTSNGYAFTSWWADSRNKPITRLTDFAKTFFAKHALLNILTKYCVFDTDRKLLVMRPYQIVAAERILQRIVSSHNYNRPGTPEAGGYIWHTTGSGKTLTSFKVAQLACGLDGIQKVIFVVDRKDLDYQTIKEYERFEKGAANSNTSTAILKKQLEDPSAKIIVTTIQKLSRFVAAAKHAIYDARVVIIFDECHRSQFGDMHALITRRFKRYHLFGFTGTPIFAANAAPGGNPLGRTTEQVFGDMLHAYTIVDAISDKNVLPFRLEYVNTIKAAPAIRDKKVSAIDTERALLAPERIAGIVGYILRHFHQKTKRSVGAYRPGGSAGFNSIFATASIDAAKLYYQEFAKQQKELPKSQQLSVGIIFSYAPNEEVAEPDMLPEESFEVDALDISTRNFLATAIQDYNKRYKATFDTSADGFQNYYRDFSDKLKKGHIDIAIVVNMFLTGFDATTLNTLWVDKNLRAHGLIQAYSRTNRILNSVKTYGNIVSFRNLEQATNEALALFGNKDAKSIVLLKPYAEYHAEYSAKVAELYDSFGPGDHIAGEARQKKFVALFGSVLKLRNILTAFDDFLHDDTITERDLQEYQSTYLHLYSEFRNAAQAEKESINDDVVFEIELIKQVEINVDYILQLVQEYAESGSKKKKQDLRASISRAVDSTLSLRNKKDLIEQFLERVSTADSVNETWGTFIDQKREEELEAIITNERLDAEKTRAFVADALRNGAVPTRGTALAHILPPISKFADDTTAKNYAETKHRVEQLLLSFFDRFFSLISTITE